MSRRGRIIQKCLEGQSASLSNDGALLVKSGAHTGRCPEAKFIVKDKTTEGSVDWSANQSMTEEEWEDLEGQVSHYMRAWVNHGKEFHIVHAAAGRKTRWESRTRKVFKFICENPVQALFVQNMFEKVEEGLGEVIDHECEVYCFPGARKEATVAINFSKKIIIITGTSYLGEIKKSVFTYMNYILTDVNVLPMHCSVNVDLEGENPTIFFGLSGTGKTTLSSSPDRMLLGDDEHGWTPGVLFNIESGCYAKTIDLSPEREPEIFKAANKFGSILENVVAPNGEPDYSDDSITKNGRASYPLSHLDNYVKTGCVFSNPVNVVMLTCDAFGVLPAVSRLSPEQAREMFLVGYTSKVAGTEMGVSEPVATFSSCFGAPFLPRDPNVYADLLVSFLENQDVNCWLVNTGWAGGPYGVGDRMNLSVTRTIVKSIVDGTMSKQSFFVHKPTELSIPRIVPEMTSFDTRPERSWESLSSYKKQAKHLMELIKKERLKFK